MTKVSFWREAEGSRRSAWGRGSGRSWRAGNFLGWPGTDLHKCRVRQLSAIKASRGQRVYM